MSIAFPGESADYRAARDRLLEQEIERGSDRRDGAAAAGGRAMPFMYRLDQLDGAAEHARQHINFWGSELLYMPTDGDQEPRHVGALEPLWNLFDFTPEGRPNN